MKRDLKASAQAFQAEGKVSSDPVGELSRSKDVLFLCFCFVHCINPDVFCNDGMGFQLLMPREDFCSSGANL